MTRCACSALGTPTTHGGLVGLGGLGLVDERAQFLTEPHIRKATADGHEQRESG